MNANSEPVRDPQPIFFQRMPTTKSGGGCHQLGAMPIARMQNLPATRAAGSEGATAIHAPGRPAPWRTPRLDVSLVHPGPFWYHLWPLKIPVQKWGFEWENPSTNGGLSIARFDFNAYSDRVYGELMRTPYHIYSLIGIHRAWSLGCAYGGIPKVVQTGHRAIEFFTIQAGDAWHDTTWIWGRAFSFHFVQVTTMWHSWSICCSMWRTAFVWIWAPWILRRHVIAFGFGPKPVTFLDFPHLEETNIHVHHFLWRIDDVG
jgi:hypothetical protein